MFTTRKLRRTFNRAQRRQVRALVRQARDAYAEHERALAANPPAARTIPPVDGPYENEFMLILPTDNVRYSPRIRVAS